MKLIKFFLGKKVTIYKGKICYKFFVENCDFYGLAKEPEA